MNMDNLVNAIFGHKPEKQIKDEDDFAHYMESALKGIFGDDVKFTKVKHVDDGKDDIHINITSPDEHKFDDEDDNEGKFVKEVMNVVTEDEVDMVKHLVRKIAQQHKKEMPLEGIYSAVAAHLADESDKLLRHKEKARYEAQKAAKVKAETLSKFNDFTQGLTKEEQDALDELLAEV